MVRRLGRTAVAVFGALTGALGSALLLPAPSALAAPSAQLVYVRDASASACPDETNLRAAVKRRVGYDPFFPWAKTTVVVEIAGAGDHFVAHVRMVDHGLAQGDRELRSANDRCAGLIDAAALAISIALDMNAPAQDPAQAPESAPTPTPTPESTPTPTPTPAPPDDAPSPAPAVVHGLIGLEGVAAIGASPPPIVVPAIDLWVAVRRGIGSLDLDLRGDAPSSAHGAGGSTATVLLFAATGGPCLHLGPAFACALGAFSWLHASGDGPSAHSGADVFPSAGARLGVEVPLADTLVLRIRGDALFNLALPPVYLNGQQAWKLPLASGIFAAGLAFRFP
ncbi:MAG TPA: hypothetical protein VH044_03850 [Polyangiaceae bacterium]|jgi:hypothetical protein|nr:hypothetical protein [Polyangiaceae bacterium]